MAKTTKRHPNSKKAVEFLANSDPRLKALIQKVGPPKLVFHSEKEVFEALASAIIGQQLHGKAAESIRKRFKSLSSNPTAFPTPQWVLKTPQELLLTAGLSRAKSMAIHDLALGIVTGEIPDRKKAELMSDHELIESLTKVKGIGRWTVEMFLIFTLGRTDVWPVHDFAVRKGYVSVFRKRKNPTPKELDLIGEKWRPYRSMLAWYMWRATELKDL